ncbi:hypothetical protein [Ruegeria jejuensis]|uniref:hypothetical protein n=1 Tax=Ruegeria jejuensis TaxID=3233338 RepID=UPI00355BF745
MDIKEALVDVVKERWNDSKAPVLYSQVPKLLRRKGIDYREALDGQSLKDFILMAQLDQLKSIQSPEDEKIWALVPADVSSDEKELFASYKEASGAKKRGRFDKLVWQAFTHQLSEGVSRLLSVSDSGCLSRDVPHSEAQAVEGFILIDLKYIQTDPSARTYGSVCANIEAWCADNQVDVEMLMYVPRQPSLSAFWAKISELSPDDLGRISIPADIVQKLVSKK